MSLNVENFAFQCGDVVIHKSAEKAGGTARRFVVVERRVHQCSRGHQIFYAIRGATNGIYSGDPITPLYQVNEIELVLATDQLKT